MPWSPSVSAAAFSTLFRAYLADVAITAIETDAQKAIYDAIVAVAGGGGALFASPLLIPSAKAAAFAATTGYHYRCTGAAYAATLPAGATVAGQMCSVLNVSATLVTVTPAGADTISGEASWPLADPYESVLLVAHSTGWDVIGQW